MISSRDKNGAARCRRGAHAAGADKIRKAIALDPILPEQSVGLAEVRVKAGQREAAQVALRETHGVDPNDAAAWNLQPGLLSEKGEMPEAIYGFQKAIRLRPREGSYLYDYALLLARLNRLDEAFQPALEAVRVNPKLAEAHELLGGLFESYRKRRGLTGRFWNCSHLPAGRTYA